MKTIKKKQKRAITKKTELLIFMGDVLLIILTIFVALNMVKQSAEQNYSIPSISSAQAINMSNSNMKILVAELNNDSYSGSFIVSGISPILPTVYLWEGNTYELLNASNLTYGLMNEVWSVEYDNNTNTYIKEGVPSLADNNIISAYSSQFGSDRSELIYYTCPNYMRNTIKDALNGGNEMLDALSTSENCYVSSSYYVVGN